MKIAPAGCAGNVWRMLSRRACREPVRLEVMKISQKQIGIKTLFHLPARSLSPSCINWGASADTEMQEISIE